MTSLEIIKDITENLLKIMGFQAEVVLEQKENGLRVNIKTEEAPFLIGQGGANLVALQELIKRLVYKKTANYTPFLLDVNDYRQHRINLLEELARDKAEEALAENRTIFLEPMKSYERRIIHLVLANYEGLLTESQGEEPKRRVVIKPRTYSLED